MTKKQKIPRFGVPVRFFCLLAAFIFIGVTVLPTFTEGPEPQTSVLPGTQPTGISDESAEGSVPDEAIQMQNTPALLADNTEDPNFILIEKRFSGLAPDLIPQTFRVTVSSDGGMEYSLDRDNAYARTVDADNTVIWRWKITDAGTGMYTVRESGETVEGYTVTKNGEGTVQVKAADFKVSVPVHETTCSHVNWPVRIDGDSDTLFAATLTQGGIAVISKTPLSASRRAAVSEAVLKINGPWKPPVYFYSIEEQFKNGTGFELNGATITYRSDTEEVIIGKTRNWQHVAALQYSISEADNPEIFLCNTYTKAIADVTVLKEVTGNMADFDKVFPFTVSVQKNGQDTDYLLNGEPRTGSAAFSLKHGESVRIEGIPVGAKLTVTEENDMKDRYEASFSRDGEEAIAGDIAVIENVTKDGHMIRFINRKDVLIDTGVALDSAPYILISGAVLIGFVWFLLCRKFTVM